MMLREVARRAAVRFRWVVLALLLSALVLPEWADAARRRTSKRSTKSKGKSKGKSLGKSKGKYRQKQAGKRKGRGRRSYEPRFFVPTIERGFRTVIINPGHGGFDNGGIPGQRYSEKELVLDTSVRLQKLLERAGIRVIMTRSDDTFIPLGTRVAIANATEDSIFISVHYNASFNPDARGFETYYFHAASYPLAARIHRNLLATNLSEDRGLIRRGFYVIRNTRIPGVLLELGFLTNEQEGSAATNRSYRQRCAEAVAKAILETRREGG